MNNDFFVYLQQLELMAFFSGYPLLYTVIFFIVGNQQSKRSIKSRIVSLLPFAYALSGTLYLGLQIKNLYPDYSVENIRVSLQQPYLKIWGILSILFWIPALSKKPVLALVHSLVYFLLLIKNLFWHYLQSPADKAVIKNYMQMHTNSLLLNLAAIAAITVVYTVFFRFKRHKESSRT